MKNACSHEVSNWYAGRKVCAKCDKTIPLERCPECGGTGSTLGPDAYTRVKGKPPIDPRSDGFCSTCLGYCQVYKKIA